MVRYMSNALTNEQLQVLAKQRISMELSPFEQEAILEMRKILHGKITIIMMEGIPRRYEFSNSKFFFDDAMVAGA